MYNRLSIAITSELNYSTSLLVKRCFNADYVDYFFSKKEILDVLVLKSNFVLVLVPVDKNQSLLFSLSFSFTKITLHCKV